VDLGAKQGKLVFWRGSSYLPYWENASGERFYVEELIPRKGDGNERMPDKVNTYSRVSLVENTDRSVTVHWRYLPEFEGSNPHGGVLATNFVDEYFTIRPSGELTRTVRQGTLKIDDWNDPENHIRQEFRLSPEGFKDVLLTPARTSFVPDTIRGNALIAESAVEPVAWFRFDEGTGDRTMESKQGSEAEIAGHKTVWKPGISGTALQFDGYRTVLGIPAGQGPKPVKAITLEGWVAIGAYPWSWCPLVQQADDVPEEVRLFRGGYDITDLEKREGDLSVGLVGGDPANQEGDVDVETEIDYDEMDFVVKYQKEDDKGYFLGINGHGYPGFKLRVAGVWEELVGEVQLKRYTWHHLAAI
jgi:hypothetical protein